MRFDCVLIMGANKVACDCTVLLAGEIEKKKLAVLETAEMGVSMLSKVCKKQGVRYMCYSSLKDINEWLHAFVEGRKVLIVSANNRYIFKKNLISKPGVEIINFHYALLPDYRGMNIPTWVIYNGEQKTGITWHHVTEEIDHGRIIDQRGIEINKQTTAFDIARQGMILAKESFESFFLELLAKEISGREVFYPENGKVYRMKELPDNGYLDADNVGLSIDHVSRILRAYDYHGMEVIPGLKVKYCGNEYYVEKYTISEERDMQAERVWRNCGEMLIMSEKKMEISIQLCKIEGL